MRIIEYTFPRLPPHWGKSGVPRSTGVHVTDLIRSYLESIEPPKKATVAGGWGGGFTDLDSTCELGFCWERALETALGARLDYSTQPDEALYEWAELQKKYAPMLRPGEVMLDGVALSLDGYLPDEKEVVETKLVWQSSRNFDLKSKARRKWLMQAKSYCKAMGSGCVTVNFLVCFVMADWSPQSAAKGERHTGPLVREFQVVFEQEEIDANWELLISHGKSVGLLPKKGAAQKKKTFKISKGKDK